MCTSFVKRRLMQMQMKWTHKQKGNIGSNFFIGILSSS